MKAQFDLNSMVMEIDELEDQINADADPKVYINDATVTVTIKKDGTPITGQTWPLNLPFVAGSNGRYHDVVSNAVVVVKGEKLQAEFTVGVGADPKKQAFFILDLPVKERKANLS